MARLLGRMNLYSTMSFSIVTNSSISSPLYQRDVTDLEHAILPLLYIKTRASFAQTNPPPGYSRLSSFEPYKEDSALLPNKSTGLLRLVMHLLG